MPALHHFSTSWLSAWAGDMLHRMIVIPTLVGRVQVSWVELGRLSVGPIGVGRGSKIDINKLRAAVEPHLEGRRMEHVNVFYEGAYRDMFVGEFSTDDIRNVLATEIYHNNVRVHDPAKYDPMNMPPVCGPAVLFPDMKVWL